MLQRGIVTQVPWRVPILQAFRQSGNAMTNERKTASILQRVPVILAVTAASYGLQFPPAAGKGDASRPQAKQGAKAHQQPPSHPGKPVREA
jgi:hypothetical protein